MIHLFIKENVKNKQRMSVRDNRGQIIYIIEGRWGRKNDKMSIYKTTGERLWTMKQLKLSPIPVFELFTGNEKTGTLRKHPGLFGLRDSYFTLHPQNWVITGDFEDLYFTTHKDNELIMECEKDLNNGATVYELIVKYEEDTALSALITTLFDHYSRKKVEEEKVEYLSDENYKLGFLNSLALSFSKSNGYSPKKYTKTR